MKTTLAHDTGRTDTLHLWGNQKFRGALCDHLWILPWVEATAHVSGPPGSQSSQQSPPWGEWVLLRAVPRRWMPAFRWVPRPTKSRQAKLRGVWWDSLSGTSLGVRGLLSEMSKRQKSLAVTRLGARTSSRQLCVPHGLFSLCALCFPPQQEEDYKSFRGTLYIFLY